MQLFTHAGVGLLALWSSKQAAHSQPINPTELLGIDTLNCIPLQNGTQLVEHRTSRQRDTTLPKQPCGRIREVARGRAFARNSPHIKHRATETKVVHRQIMVGGRLSILTRCASCKFAYCRRTQRVGLLIPFPFVTRTLTNKHEVNRYDNHSSNLHLASQDTGKKDQEHLRSTATEPLPLELRTCWSGRYTRMSRPYPSSSITHRSENPRRCWVFRLKVFSVSISPAAVGLGQDLVKQLHITDFGLATHLC